MPDKYVKAKPQRNGRGQFDLKLICPSGKERIVPDICKDSTDAQYYCDKINRNSVSDCHIDDVVEDLLP